MAVLILMELWSISYCIWRQSSYKILKKFITILEMFKSFLGLSNPFKDIYIDVALKRITITELALALVRLFRDGSC